MNGLDADPIARAALSLGAAARAISAIAMTWMFARFGNRLLKSAAVVLRQAQEMQRGKKAL